MQLEMFEFTRDVVPLDVVLNLKRGYKISMIVGSVDDDKEDIILESVEFLKASDLFSEFINPENLRNVYVRILCNEKRHEISVPIMIIRKIIN